MTEMGGNGKGVGIVYCTIWLIFMLSYSDEFNHFSYAAFLTIILLTSTV
jgi:hypothetical protein